MRHELRLPLDDRLMLVKVWSYKVTGNGKRDGGHRIIPVIADVRRPWHDSCRLSEVLYMQRYTASRWRRRRCRSTAAYCSDEPEHLVRFPTAAVNIAYA